jgi:SAM-dependent methyltransferase
MSRDDPKPVTSAFSDEQNHRSYPDGVGDTYWHVARKQVIGHALSWYAPHARVLDVGCGTGDAVEWLRARGFDCYGSEISAAPVPPRLSSYVFRRTDALALPSAFRATVGTILLLDVLEHLPEPATLLRSLVEAFPNLTTTVVTLPARRELWSNWDEYYGHYLRYDEDGARRLLDEAGFTLVELRYFFHALYWPLRWRARFGKRTLDMKRPRLLPLHRALAAVLAWEARVLPGAWPGSSLIAVAHPLRT